MKLTVREWLQQGGGFTSALLAFFEEPTLENQDVVWARADAANKRRFGRAIADAADLMYAGSHDRVPAMRLSMGIEWTLFGDLDAEVTHEEFRKCFRNP